MLCIMERMGITVLAITRRSGQIQARARATAKDATIWLAVSFEIDASDAEVWERARDAKLRYLDPA